MNLLLVSPESVDAKHHVRITGRQHKHIEQTLKAKIGDTLSVGIIDGLMGEARLLSKDSESSLLALACVSEPPPALPLKLVLAMPRPKMLRRTLHHAIAMGVKEIVLINSWKVEKSYWQTPWLEEEALRELSILALEQAKDTRMPRISIRTLFKPFVEDELAAFAEGTYGIVAHPITEQACPVDIAKPCTLAIGPEGGFTQYEVDKISEQGFQAFHLGPRILRVESAVPALISRLFPSL